MTTVDEANKKARLERARKTGLFRYSLVQELAEASLTVKLLSLPLLASRDETAVEGDVAMAAGYASRQGACTGLVPGCGYRISG